MSHEDLLTFERTYVRLAAKPCPTREEVQTLHFIQSLMRDHKRRWEAQ